MSLIAPHGYPAILRTYGCILGYVEDKPAWEAEILRLFPLPRPLPYAYGPAEITRIRAHRLVGECFVEALAKCLERGVPPERLSYGGIYAWRAQRAGAKLSTHSWGIALDLDPVGNPLGEPWDGGERRHPTRGTFMLHPTIVEVFETLGFTWGGRWTRPDVMHLQACSGY